MTAAAPGFIHTAATGPGKTVNAVLDALVSEPPTHADVHQLAILALAARYEAEAVAFWEAVVRDPDLGG